MRNLLFHAVPESVVHVIVVFGRRARRLRAVPAVSSSAAASRQQVSQWQTASPYDGTCPTGYVLGSWKAHNQWHTQRQDKRQKAGEDGPLPLPSSDALPAEARGVSRSGALSGADRPAGRTTLDSGAWVAASHLVAGSHRADTTQTGTATATQPFFCVPSYTGGGRSLRRHNMAAGYCPAPQASARPHRPLTHCLVADPRGMEGVEHDDPLWARVVRTGDQRCVDEPTNPPPPLPTVTTTAAGSPPLVDVRGHSERTPNKRRVAGRDGAHCEGDPQAHGGGNATRGSERQEAASDPSRAGRFLLPGHLEQFLASLAAHPG
ncbi:hypothetical protein Purlil1_8525 [Purpureocillium lilacinum]|uniref:Uncharacterized protein n=1 Tax=Purpureocillium lilacinum TaxID=33203 RepID=A0ABR0BT91_PURLI|nr:hypothetical protein Purlil1_8525 [Purpureocillium lilacinum]